MQVISLMKYLPAGKLLPNNLSKSDQFCSEQSTTSQTPAAAMFDWNYGSLIHLDCILDFVQWPTLDALDESKISKLW